MCIYMLHGTVFSHHYSNSHWFVVVLPLFGYDSHKVHGMCTTEGAAIALCHSTHVED